jgi:protocatechuate 3,4-dioxygenase beta subunit
MKRKALFILVCLVVSTALAACRGTPQAELDAQATKMAVGILATKTAEAPTPTNTPTHTPTSTITPTDTPTPTSTPTATSTPTPEPTPTPTPTSIVTPTPTLVPSLSGRVTDAATGRGIAGAMVEARLAAGWHGWDYSATTASDGSYALFGLPAGDYVVRATAAGYAREYWDNVTPSHEATVINISAGVATSGIDFVLTEGGSVSGHIYQSDGITPIEGAQVFVRPGKYWEDAGFWATTDAEGAYNVEGFALGNFRVEAEAPGYAGKRYYDGAEGVYGWWNAANVIVTPPFDTADIDINLHLAASISGHVYQSDGSTPIPNVGIVADTTDIPGLEGYGGVPSNDDGYYIIEDLPPGDFMLRADNPVGFASGFYDSKPDRGRADVVTIAEGEALTGKDFSLQAGGPLRGHVYNEAGEPISGASMGAYVAGGDWVALGDNTDPSGLYEFWLATGDYNIQTWSPGYVTEWYNDHYARENAALVHVEAPNEVSGIDFYLAKAGSISGHVYEADGSTPIANASLYAFPIAGDHPGAGANTGPDGSYAIEGLPSGNYKVQATVSGHVAQYYNNAPDEASATEVGVNAPADTPGVDFRLSRASQ